VPQGPPAARTIQSTRRRDGEWETMGSEVQIGHPERVEHSPAPHDLPPGAGELSVPGALSVLRRWFWLIAIMVALAVAGGVAIYTQQQPQYRARAEMAVTGASFDLLDPFAQQRPQDVERALLTEVQILSSPPVRRSAAELVGAPHTIDVNVVEGTNIIRIVATSPRAAAAAQAANAYALAYMDFRSEQTRERLLATRDALQAQLQSIVPAASATPPPAAPGPNDPRTADLQSRIDQLDLALAVEHLGVELYAPADVPPRPVSPNLTSNILLGLVVGTTLGTATAFALEQRRLTRSS
jgi:polysaccharide biosynthesis transport protein